MQAQNKKTFSPDSKEAIAERVEAKLAEKGLNRYELAHLAHVSYRLLYNVCHAEVRARPASYGKIAHALRVSYEWLTTGAGADHLPEPSPAIVREQPAHYGTVKGLTLDVLCDQIARLLGIDEKKVMAAMLKLVAERNGG